jgi:Transposase, Mutator family
VANRPVYAAIGVTIDGGKDVLGLWMGTGGEGAKFWMSVLTDLRNRGVRDVFFLVCDGLKGLPDVVENVWPQAVVQTCIIHYADHRIMPTIGHGGPPTPVADSQTSFSTSDTPPRAPRPNEDPDHHLTR